MDSAKAILARRGLRPKRSWGQNFLSDPGILRRIADACAAGPEDTVVELGAGLGHLTAALAATGARVVAVERDRDLAAALRGEIALPNVSIVEANAVGLDFAVVAGAARPIVAGNLPYQLSGRILFALVERHDRIRRAVFTLQREVAERIAAEPGGRDYGVLSVLLQAYGTVERLFDLPAAAFHPAPEVDSAVVRFEPYPPERTPNVDGAALARLVKAAFAGRRKTLANTLKASRLIRASSLGEALKQAGIDGRRRAETLAPAEFVALERARAAAGG